MRAWIDSIFAFIGTSSLTDPEYDSIDQSEMVSLTYNQAAYDQMAGVLIAREAVSTLQDRLVAVFKAKGFDAVPVSTAVTNIYIGDAL